MLPIGNKIPNLNLLPIGNKMKNPFRSRRTNTKAIRSEWASVNLETSDGFMDRVSPSVLRMKKAARRAACQYKHERLGYERGLCVILQALFAACHVRSYSKAYSESCLDCFPKGLLVLLGCLIGRLERCWVNCRGGQK